MAQNKSYGKQVFASLVVTVLVLAALTYGFSAYLIPKYQITQAQIYDFAIKLFPILIGLVMIQSGVVIAHRKDEEYSEEVDKLPPNAYDEPLTHMPMDDPAKLKTQNLPLSQPVVQETVQPIITSPENEVEKTVAPAVAPETAKEEEFEDTLQSRLSSELENASEMDYDLTLVVAKSAQQSTNEILAKLAESNAFSYEMEEGNEALIFPFFNQEETENVMKQIMSTLENEQPGSEVSLAYASRCGRTIDADLLLSEAKA